MEPLNFKPRDFVHLHLHSDYSLLQSTIQLKPLANRLGELEMKACAITDYANLYGAVSFYSTMRAAGVRPIIGYEAFAASGSRLEKGTSVRSGERPYYNLVLLAKNFEGYQNLVHLSSKAFTEGFHYKPRIDLDLLAEKSSGLIALSGWADGSIGHFLTNGDETRAAQSLSAMREIFGEDNFYVEIQNHGSRSDSELLKQTVALAKANQVSLVATNDAHYLTSEDARARDILICIGEGRTLDAGRESETDSFVRSADEMWSVFGAELPEALTNTLKIAEQCELELPIGDDNLTLPNFPIPPESGLDSIEAYFEKVLDEGFEERKQELWLPMQQAGTLRYTLEAYRERLLTEIETIKKMGFPGYFLIVWEFIDYARKQGIPVGPGRGSAAGSLAAYCLRITDIDPLQYDLLFERFLNPERISMPDIDIDFCIRGRGAVIDHVTEVYGRESVCQIVTFGTMASRAAIKDVGRALSMPYGDVEKIAKMIPPPVRGRNVSISQALTQVPELKKAFDTDPKVQDLLNVALRVEGCARHTSVHAAGVVISPKPLHELVPVAMSVKNELTSQYPMGDLEKVGMLKMDFLGLTTLTVIEDCLRSMRERDIEINWGTIPLNDEKTMKLFGDGRTDAVFQFESSGMQEICRQLKPKELEDLSALNALYRPGPIDGGMIPDFIARHRGEKAVRYLVPQMKEILSNTFGVLVYQEQIMQLAQKLAGYSLGEADMMRRAMGKKKREEMAKHEKKFIDGAMSNGIKQAHAEEIFKLMAQFADYGFNRSHSIAYAYLAFQTAYLKAHYPSYFFSAVLSHESDDSAKVYKYSSELRSVGLQLLPPDVNQSGEGFTPLDDAVRFGLSAIKGIGSSTINAIERARESGPFTSVTDMMSRLEQNSINRRGLESLICAGAFDSLNAGDVSVDQWRANLFSGVDQILQRGSRAWDDKVRGQSDLFGMGGTNNGSAADDLPVVEPWSQTEISRQEKAALGFYLSVHPLDGHTQALADLRIGSVEDAAAGISGDMITLAGIVSTVQVRFSKKGNRFCTFRLDDRSGGIKCVAWGEAFGRYADSLKDDELLIVSGKLEASEGQEATLIMNDAKRLDDAIPSRARAMSIYLPDAAVDEKYFDELADILNKDQGGCDVYINLSVNNIDLKILSLPLKVQGSRRLENKLGEKGCRVEWT
ncbi:MAG: DNA polymerase III subunit alpha [Acidobacteriota bacterium]